MHTGGTTLILDANSHLAAVVRRLRYVHWGERRTYEKFVKIHSTIRRQTTRSLPPRTFDNRRRLKELDLERVIWIGAAAIWHVLEHDDEATIRRSAQCRIANSAAAF